jgi:hypothetical protein
MFSLDIARALRDPGFASPSRTPEGRGRRSQEISRRGKGLHPRTPSSTRDERVQISRPPVWNQTAKTVICGPISRSPAAPGDCQYHLPRAKPPKATSPMSVIISRSSKLPNNMTRIPTIDDDPPNRDIPPILRSAMCPSFSVGRPPMSELARRPEHCGEYDAYKSDDQSHDPTRHVGRDEDCAQNDSQGDNSSPRHEAHEDRLGLEPSPLSAGDHRSAAPGLGGPLPGLVGGVTPSGSDWFSHGGPYPRGKVPNHAGRNPQTAGGSL